MAATYEPISTTTLVSNQNGVVFSGITSVYTDLLIVVNASTDNAAQMWVSTNSSGGGLFTSVRISGNGSSNGTAIYSGQDEWMLTGGSDVSTQVASFNAIIHIFDYSNTNKFKGMLARCGASGTATFAVAGVRRDTSTISTVSIDLTGANTYVSGSTFTLYGIKAA
jgi:hypothetical protein